MSFKGSKYTWLNKSFKNKKALIFERLDCFLANNDFITCFPDAQVLHLPKTHSYHYPLLLILFKENIFKNESIFRFETKWVSHPDFIKIIDKI